MPEETSIQTETTVPEEVARLLQPVAENGPAGTDLSNDETFLRLQLEIGKVRPDYDQCERWCETLLVETAKDLHVMLWLTFVWYRKEQLRGLRNGLMLTASALEQFSDSMFPADRAQQVKAFSFFNRRQLGKIVASEKVDGSNAEIVQQLHAEFARLMSVLNSRFGADHQPSLRELARAIESLDADAKRLLAKPDPPKPASHEQPHREEPKRGESAPTQTAADRPAQPAAQAITVSGDPVQTIRRALVSLFEEQVDGKRKTKTPPADPAMYGVTRILQWSKIKGLPPDKDGVTELEGPSKEKQASLAGMLAAKKWSEVIASAEARFIDDERLRFWLDVQRYICHALEQKDGEYVQAAEEIKFQLARFVNHFPRVTELKFKDKTTSFADKATAQWIESDVRPLLGKGGSDHLLPPILGEEYDDINKFYESACAELPSNFEQHAAAMQAGIAGEIRAKGRFLRMLNLATYCLEAKKLPLAKVLLGQLMRTIVDRKLDEWEPALAVATWQSMYLTNIHLLRFPEDAEAQKGIEFEQQELFDKISGLDCIRALSLITNNSKEGA